MEVDLPWPVLPYYYISYPLALDRDAQKPGASDMGYMDNKQYPVDAGHMPHIQGADERLVLARWIQTVLVRYGNARLLNRTQLNEEYAALVHVVLDYQLNGWRSVNEFFLAHGGNLACIKDAKERTRLLHFMQSFATIGNPMPAHDAWTLYTGESPEWSTALLECCLASKAAQGAPQLVPMQISATWNFNVGLHFARGGVLIALHYRPDDVGSQPIRAHLLQELGQYGPDVWSQAHECEVLLQPGLRVAFPREEILPRINVHNVNRYATYDEPLENLVVMHVWLLPPAAVVKADPQKVPILKNMLIEGALTTMTLTIDDKKKGQRS